MKLKYHFEFVNVGDEITAVPVGENTFNGVLLINSTMKDILELLATENTSEDIITNHMLEKYCNITRQDMSVSVHQICEELKEKGLLI